MRPVNIAFDIQGGLLLLLALIVTTTLHEFAHAYAADRLGDDGPRKLGRVSLLPVDQYDPLRVVALILFSICGFGFAWGKPLPINTENFAKPRRDDLLVAAAGPAVNLVLAAALAIMMRIGYLHLALGSPWHRLLDIAFQVNVITLLFNLVPLPPFDGARILGNALPEETEKTYQQFLQQWGMLFLIAILFFGSGLILRAAQRAQEYVGGRYEHARPHQIAPRIPPRTTLVQPTPARPDWRGTPGHEQPSSKITL